MSAGRFAAILDALQQVAEVAVGHAQRAQLLKEANATYRTAVAARDDRAAFLLALDERLDGMNLPSRERLLMTVHTLLNDQIAFDDACLKILTERDKG